MRQRRNLSNRRANNVYRKSIIECDEYGRVIWYHIIPRGKTGVNVLTDKRDWGLDQISLARTNEDSH